MTELRRMKINDIDDLNSTSFYVPGDVVVDGDTLTIPVMPADADPSIRGETRARIEKFLTESGFVEGVKLFKTELGSPVVGGQKVRSIFVNNPNLGQGNS